jgi:hypothetical protein
MTHRTEEERTHSCRTARAFPDFCQWVVVMNDQEIDDLHGNIREAAARDAVQSLPLSSLCCLLSSLHRRWHCVCRRSCLSHGAGGGGRVPKSLSSRPCWAGSSIPPPSRSVVVVRACRSDARGCVFPTVLPGVREARGCVLTVIASSRRSWSRGCGAVVAIEVASAVILQWMTGATAAVSVG